MYIDKSLGFRFNTYYEKTDFELKKVVKFASVSKKNIIKFSSCQDSEYKIFASDWDIYVMWIDPEKVTNSDRKNIKRKFSFIMPLYAVFGENYVLITKIISKQIFQQANKCTSLDIMDLFIFEMGGVLCEKNLRPPLKQFHGSDNYKFNVIWSIPPLKEILHITPKVHGWFSINTQLCIKYILKNYEYKNILEFGSWFGKSSTFILKNMKKFSTLYCFDKFQNIMNSSFSSKQKDKLDLFFLRTPRFETFCRNLSPFITDNKIVYTIKYDINRVFEGVIKPLSLHFDVVFIDSIKKTNFLIEFIEKCLIVNPKVIIIGDDYFFESVKRAICFIRNKYSYTNIFITDDSYIMSRLNLNKLEIQKFIKKNYFPKKTDSFYIYEVIIYLLKKKNYDKIIHILKTYDKIDINKQIKNYNDNTLYHIFIIHRNKNKLKMKELMNFIHKNFKPQKVKNVLGLDYSYYIGKNHDFF